MLTIRTRTGLYLRRSDSQVRYLRELVDKSSRRGVNDASVSIHLLTLLLGT